MTLTDVDLVLQRLRQTSIILSNCSALNAITEEKPTHMSEQGKGCLDASKPAASMRQIYIDSEILVLQLYGQFGANLGSELGKQF